MKLAKEEEEMRLYCISQGERFYVFADNEDRDWIRVWLTSERGLCTCCQSHYTGGGS